MKFSSDYKTFCFSDSSYIVQNANYGGGGWNVVICNMTQRSYSTQKKINKILTPQLILACKQSKCHTDKNPVEFITCVLNTSMTAQARQLSLFFSVSSRMTDKWHQSCRCSLMYSQSHPIAT